MFFYTNEKALCKTIQLKLVYTDLSMTLILHVTGELQDILEGGRRAVQLFEKIWENDIRKTSNVAFKTLYFKLCGLKKIRENEMFL